MTEIIVKFCTVFNRVVENTERPHKGRQKTTRWNKKPHEEIITDKETL